MPLWRRNGLLGWPQRIPQRFHGLELLLLSHLFDRFHRFILPECRVCGNCCVTLGRSVRRSISDTSGCSAQPHPQQLDRLATMSRAPKWAPNGSDGVRSSSDGVRLITSEKCAILAQFAVVIG